MPWEEGDGGDPISGGAVTAVALTFCVAGQVWVKPGATLELGGGRLALGDLALQVDGATGGESRAPAVSRTLPVRLAFVLMLAVAWFPPCADQTCNAWR